MSHSPDSDRWLVRFPRPGETCVFSHGYWDAYSSVSERVGHWKRDALLFDRVYARCLNPNTPPDIPIELSFGLDTVEQSIRAWDFSMSAGMAEAYGNLESMERELGTTSIDLGHDRQLAEEYSQAGIMGEWSYASTGAFLRRFSEGEQVAYEGALINIPLVVAEAHTWEHILEFRDDPEAKRKYRDLRLWLRSGLKADSSQHAADIIGQKIDDYRWAIERHGLQTSLGALKTVFDWRESKLIFAAMGFAGVMGRPLWAALAGGLGISMQVGALITERHLDVKDISRGPNREVAILYEIQKRFGNPGNPSTKAHT